MAERNGGALLILSGDRHAGAIYSDTPERLDETIFEVTSSSLNVPAGASDLSAREPDPRRLSPLHGGANFGLLDLDWRRAELVVSLRDGRGQPLARQRMTLKPKRKR